MAFTFRGFFTKCGKKEAKEMIAEAKKEWPKAKGKVVNDPFEGFGLSMPELRDDPKITDLTTELEEQLLTEMLAVEENLPKWSKKYPKNVFVYTYAECVGGTCLYSGYVCQKGKVIKKVESGKFNLKKLIVDISPELGESYFFKPLTRNFFD